jgi:pimeloyl-ACP methyl ester carboxylesterase
MRFGSGTRAVVVGAAVLATVATVHTNVQGGRPERFTVTVDRHPIAVWARRPAQPWASVLLVHGRTWSARPDFDLQVPGVERSVMSSLVARGVAAYALDLRGYGETAPDRSGWLTPRRAASDVVAVLAWINAQHPSLRLPAIVGWSRGGAIGMLAAQMTPLRASRLVVFGFAFDPDLRFVNADTPRNPPRIRNTREAAESDFISPDVTSPAVVQAFAEQALATDPFLANLRNDAELNGIDPKRITIPALVIYGDRDPGVIPEDVSKMAERLGTPDKRVVVLRGADHAAHLEDTHVAWIDAVVERLK